MWVAALQGIIATDVQSSCMKTLEQIKDTVTMVC